MVFVRGKHFMSKVYRPLNIIPPGGGGESSSAADMSKSARVSCLVPKFLRVSRERN
jgi:hypothetical protein